VKLNMEDEEEEEEEKGKEESLLPKALWVL
jgi:hypothetical protein